MPNDMQCHPLIVCGKNLPHTNKIRKPGTSASRLSVFLLLTKKRQPRCRCRFFEGVSKTLSRLFAELRGFAEPLNNMDFHIRHSRVLVRALAIENPFNILGVRPRGPSPLCLLAPLEKRNHKLKILYYD